MKKKMETHRKKPSLSTDVLEQVDSQTSEVEQQQSPKPKHAGGRPPIYKPEFPQLLIDMYNKPASRPGKKTFTTKNGTVIEEEVQIPILPTHVVDFCDVVGIRIGTFYEWLKEHPEFGEAYAHAKEYLSRNVGDNGLMGNYNAGFAGLYARNMLGWSDRQEVHATGTLKLNVVREGQPKSAPDAQGGKT